MNPVRQLRVFLRVAVCVCAVAVAGCVSAPVRQITQMAPLAGLTQGKYDGVWTCDDIRRYGDFGIGTFDRLNGEMVLLDGVFYRVGADGRVTMPPGHTRVPYATVTHFEWDQLLKVGRRYNLEGLNAWLDSVVADPDRPCAIRVQGKFLYMKARSVPAQDKPYPVLDDVIEKQSVFESQDVYGTLVGFRMPIYAGGVTSPGYHWHFLSRSLSSGGHALDFVIQEGSVELGLHQRLLLRLPYDAAH